MTTSVSRRIKLCNNAPGYAIVNGTSISYRPLIHAADTGRCYRPMLQATDTCSYYRPMLQADVFVVLIMNEHNNLTNVVIGKLGKLVHTKNCSHDCFYFINYNIIIIQVRYITIETKEATRIVYNEFLLPHSSSYANRNQLIRTASIVCCVVCCVWLILRTASIVCCVWLICGNHITTSLH